ncbi:MAG TPA: glycosyltransferase [Gemmatimonadales bacterium]|nr:glycosyltransferase [Gemmatimonadales bacterium]
MPPKGPPPPSRIGYVVKRYPRYSETWVVAEIASHEAAGLEVEVFSLMPPNDTHFQEAIARVRAPVHYIPYHGVKAVDLWTALDGAATVLPGFWGAMQAAQGEDALAVFQGALIACAVRDRAIHHLHAHFATAATSAARLASHFARVPYTFTAHAKDVFHDEVRPADLRRKLADARAVVTVSDYNRNFLKRTYGAAAARVERLYNGLDLELFPHSCPVERAPWIVAVGRLVEKKGFVDLVEACAVLRDRGCAFQCKIVGTGPLEPTLRALIDERRLAEQVDLVGPRPRSEVVALVGGAAAFAAPCVVAADGDREGLPTVLVEAMALGTPCVATDVTGIPELLAADCGILVPQHDPASLAAALQRLLTDGALRVRLATRARRRVEADFDIRSTAARLRAIFRDAGVGAVRPALARVAT